jgi:nicotinate-nucleotide adenylyltransferase
MPETLGIYGGSFDPPHLGHLILAAEALSQLRLSRVLWVLSPDPPHKTDRALTPIAQRLEMLTGMLIDAPGFELSRVEMDRPGPHFTVETLHLLKAEYASADFVLLIGGDSLRDLPGWHRPADVLAACRSLGVMRRPGDAVETGALEAVLPGIGKKLRFVDAPQLEISSSTIRTRIASGGHYRYYLHPAVYEYIEREKLYR